MVGFIPVTLILMSSPLVLICLPHVFLSLAKDLLILLSFENKTIKILLQGLGKWLSRKKHLYKSADISSNFQTPSKILGMVLSMPVIQCSREQRQEDCSSFLVQWDTLSEVSKVENDKVGLLTLSPGLHRSTSMQRSTYTHEYTLHMDVNIHKCTMFLW